MKSSEIEARRYQLITPVHPETVVRWFLDLHHHWFDGSFGANAFYGMRDLAETYLSVWVATGELPPDDNTMLQIHVASKFEEWLKSSWLVTAEFSTLAKDDMKAALVKLREKYPKHHLSISTEAQLQIGMGFTVEAIIQVSKIRVSSASYNNFMVPVEFEAATLAEALSAAMKGE